MSTATMRISIYFKILLFSLLLSLIGGRLYAQYYPVHATVQWPAPQSPYLADYYSGSRDRLIVTLLNRDLQQPLLFAKLRIKIKSTGFFATSREEVSYPILELNANVPTRLTNIDLAPYLQIQNLRTSGGLKNGQLPVGYTEFAVQVIDYYTGRALSAWHSGCSYLDVKKPSLLHSPEKDAQIGVTEPLYIRFQWMPRHQGLAGTEYEFVLKELPDNGAVPQSAFAYGNEIYRIRTRSTTLNYTHLEPILFPNRRYAWQVQAIARDGVDEAGLFENGGFSEINWFYFNDNCQAPIGLKALPRFAKVELSWNKVIGTTGYVVECRPKTKLNVYEWSRTRVAGEHLTLAQLKPGWTYEWRVGTLCTDDRPVFSNTQEFTLSSQNDELLADCGREPVRGDLSQEPHLRVKAGDVVTIGGDYPMTIIEAVALGDGWYAGRGKTRLKTIIDAPVSLRFDRLRINVDNFQIDGTVEASFDEKKVTISNIDYIDDGGKELKPATIRIREHKIDFTLPEILQFFYNPTTGELETTDAEGHPQKIKIEVPENASYEGIFPMLVTDSRGNTYQISPAKQSTAKGDEHNLSNQNEKVGLLCERVDRVGDFNTESLSSKYGYIHFEGGEGKYSFDDAREKWYQKSVKVDRFYKPFAKGYIAPWKLIPTGENDVVTAKYDGQKSIELKKVRFVSEPNSAALPARLSESEQTWTINLPSVPSGTSYDVFAVYEGLVIGKLRVVSYSKQIHKVTLVPINEVKLDKDAVEQELNAIYNPVGVQFTVDIDESLRGNYDWEVESEKDGLLSTVGKSFWGYDKELKESTEMLNLQKAYQQVVGTLDGVYLFVLNDATGLEGQKSGLQGEMPRKSRFGYIFAGNSPNSASLSRTIAHELAHGLFTLQHTFDAEYGKGTIGTTRNLLDYTETGKELVAFQWNVMANPAVFTNADKTEEGRIVVNKYLIGDNQGIAPDGRVIITCESNDSTCFVLSHIDKDQPNYISGFALVHTQSKEVVEFFEWDNARKKYASEKQTIEESANITLTFNTAAKRINTNIYKILGDRCTYQYAKVEYDPSLKQITTKSPRWKTGYRWSASESCRAAFIKEILEADRADCKDQIEEDKERLASIDKGTSPEQIVTLLHQCCLTSLKTLPFRQLSEYFVRIASQSELKEASELALLRLMNAINGKDYAQFYLLLEQDNNRLLRHLVDQMDDISIWFWMDNANYTNFIGALVWMFNCDSGNSIANRWPENIEDYALRVINMEPVSYEDIQVHWFGTSWSKKYNDGKYDAKTGDITLQDIYVNYIQSNFSTYGNQLSSFEQKEPIATVSPLTPILIVPNTEKLPLIETALGRNALSNQMYVVPAIFLKYNHDKIRNDYIEKGIVTTLDIATIALSGGTALATKVHWVRRAWALAEIVGAIGNIAVNAQGNSSPEVKQAVDTYNAAMGLIGLKNLGQGGYQFVKKLPAQTKQLLQRNKSLRSKLQQEYLKWNSISLKLKTPEANIDSELRKLLEDHEGVLGQLAGKVLRKFDKPEEIAVFLKTEKNSAFFWSGRTSKGEGVMDKALEIARSKNGNTLESLLDKYNIEMPVWDETNLAVKRIWEGVSAIYAEQVSREVRAVIGKKMRAGNVWETVELPRLKQNPNVTKITIIDPETMSETIIFTR